VCVLTDAVNMALLRPADQSGVAAESPTPFASRAVDGRGVNGGTGPACTADLLEPWWSVDLGAPIDVARVCVSNHNYEVIGQ